MPTKQVKSEEISRETLIELCRDGVVPQKNWYNRDSARAQRQLGEALALLSAGCHYEILHDPDGLNTNDQTIWIMIECEGFAYHDWGGDLDRETYYIPTRERLNDNAGGDWY
ncbi:hypothetical protein FHT44_005027 [Mycolicibacterium sp. BK634]|uniref:hypothetical protein n=1 Tax=Mycolicibacterium sp. BK634 TaxID=2587099 RepID=UPI00160AD689|nr:hypothetical protein [Mycolicibacterium sp. BK634]MBB3752515.1 hypothetical protein [Mycolicibacterium sp. BK634]